MTVAMILCTHGDLSKKLLYTTEMIIGKQKNITWVDLLPDENTDNLMKKYATSLSNLNTNLGILFLVDIWGGTPFNAAQRIMLNLNEKNYDIITGVNIPMLIEILLVRDQNQSIKKLVNIGLQSGIKSIKSVKFPENSSNQALDLKANKSKNSNIPPETSNNDLQLNTHHMVIVLIRIDDRLIHGQVVTRWAKELNINRIIVVNDEVVKDKIRSSLLTQVTPPGITAHVIDIKKAIRVYNNPKYATDRVIMLFTNPTDIVRIIKEGIPVSSVNIGGMSFAQDKKQIHNAVSVNTKDIASFIELDQLGVKLEIRKVPSDSSIKLMTLIKNK